jgi:NADH-quinone oxidoreductase subunit H
VAFNLLLRGFGKPYPKPRFMFNFMELITKFIIILVSVLVSVAYFTLCDRKIMAALQRRVGPSIVGFFGLLQPLADGVKLVLKEAVVPKNTSYGLFVGSPIFVFTLSVATWSFMPLMFGETVVVSDISILFILAMSTLSVFCIVLAGWSSNSKYAFLGALRTVSQMVSYEIVLGFIVLFIVMVSGSANLASISSFQENLYLGMALLPFVSISFLASLAETNRAPFDLPEAEAELVGGYITEYGSIGFALFFLGEYSNMLVMCFLNVIFFWGGAYNFLFIKLLMYVFLFVWVRGSFPRLRYDHLLLLCWKGLIPALMVCFVLISGVCYVM